jgi:glycosyltransferase involved in cell wall biosynthesis
MKPVLYGTIAARLTSRPRVINAVAGLGWVSSKDGGAASRRRAFVRRALGSLLRSGTTIVQNPDDERFLIEAGVPAPRIRRIAGAGVDLDHFAPAPEPPGDPTIVLAARLLWTKGVGDFVAAARLLRHRGVRARFLLAGSPDPANPASIADAEIASWIASGVVEHLGRVPDMAPVLAKSHIACLPSYYGEGIPKTLIEAAAAGRPIVTTDMPGCREAVTHGENGLLVPPRDPASLAEALATLIDDAALRQRMGAAGRARATRVFGLDRILQQTLDLYGDPVS